MIALASDMNRSIPSSSARPATGMWPVLESVAARVMNPPPVTAAAPLEVNRSTPRIESCWPRLRGTLVANPTMLSRVISRLQALGLIDRIPDPADLRSASVLSTPAGQRVDHEVKARRAAAVSRCLELLPPVRVQVLTDALPALEELADTMRQTGRPQHARQRP